MREQDFPTGPTRAGQQAHAATEVALSAQGEEPTEGDPAEEGQETGEAASRATSWLRQQNLEALAVEDTIVWQAPFDRPGVTLRVRPDAIVRGQDGELGVIDWKFPETLPARAEREDYRFSAGIGARAFGLRGTPVSWGAIVFVPLDGSRIVVDRWRIANRDKADLERFQMAMRVLGAKGKPPRPGRQCEWCFHRARCSAFTAPE